jgi:hypothetical protein
VGLADFEAVYERYDRGLLVSSILLIAVIKRLHPRTYDGTAPSHFFGELTKTPEGCGYLREQNVVRPLAAIVRQHGLESKDQAILTSLKCALWALVCSFPIVPMRVTYKLG